MKIYVITALLVVVVAIAAEPPTCPIGRVFRECGSACEKTCEDYMRSQNGDNVCTLQCVPGCYCTDGSYENRKGVCVEAETCEELDRTCAEGDDRCIIGNDIIKVEGIIKSLGKGTPNRILPEGIKIIEGFGIDGGKLPPRPERPTGGIPPDGNKPPSRPERPTGERPTRPDHPDGSKPPTRPERPTGGDRPDGGFHTRPDRTDGGDRPTRPGRTDGGDRPTRPSRTDGGDRPTRPDRPDGGDRPTRPGRTDGGDRPSREPRPGREGRNRRAH